MAKSKSKL
jgi:ribonuclease HI